MGKQIKIILYINVPMKTNLILGLPTAHILYEFATVAGRLRERFYPREKFELWRGGGEIEKVFGGIVN
jgi:hypothetical protein